MPDLVGGADRRGEVDDELRGVRAQGGRKTLVGVTTTSRARSQPAGQRLDEDHERRQGEHPGDQGRHPGRGEHQTEEQSRAAGDRHQPPGQRFDHLRLDLGEVAHLESDPAPAAGDEALPDQGCRQQHDRHGQRPGGSLPAPDRGSAAMPSSRARVAPRRPSSRLPPQPVDQVPTRGRAADQEAGEADQDRRPGGCPEQRGTVSATSASAVPARLRTIDSSTRR